MSRVKRGVMTKKRHKRLFKETKGYWGQRKNVYRRAQETHLRAMAYAFKGRKLQKRSMRSLFIVRIAAATKQLGMPYKDLIYRLNKANVALDRKMLSQLAIFEPQAFAQIVALAAKA